MSVKLFGQPFPVLTQLSLIRGHLFVGMELYRQGAVDHAKTHMKHPQDEIYASLRPAIRAPSGTTGISVVRAAIAG